MTVMSLTNSDKKTIQTVDRSGDLFKAQSLRDKDFNYQYSEEHNFKVMRKFFGYFLLIHH